MADDADRYVPFWANPLLSSFSLDRLPCWFDNSWNSAWRRWIHGVLDQGWWLDVNRVSDKSAELIARELTNMAASNRLKNMALDELSSHLTRLNGSEDLRFVCCGYRSLGDSQARKVGHSEWTDFADLGLSIKAQQWMTKSSSREGWPPLAQSGPKLILPRLLESDKRYWVAEASTSSGSTLSIFETFSRVDLGYRDSVSVWAYGQEIQLYLPIPAIWLDPKWPPLPTVLAMAYRDGYYFQAYRPPSDSLPTEDLTDPEAEP